MNHADLEAIIPRTTIPILNSLRKKWTVGNVFGYYNVRSINWGIISHLTI
jgi:hypothetical protein